MLRIALLDPIAWDYAVDTPEREPLGGSQSALCYLARALADRGHTVTCVTHTSRPGMRLGVDCVSLDSLRSDDVRQAQWDVCIVLNSAEVALRLRPHLPGHTRVVLWTQHADDQPAVAALAQLDAQLAHDAFVFVSDWQEQAYQRRFELHDRPRVVLRNAVSPACEQLLARAEAPLAGKHRPPVAVYTSTPFRGLSLLVECFPEIRREVPGLRLKVFSSMGVYRVAQPQDEAEFGPLYQACRETEGIDYVGSVSQPDLADALEGAAVLLYPNTFPETSCIAVMEAMAAGCHVVTSDLGALPETTAGFASLIPGQPGTPAYRKQFIRLAVQALQSFASQDADYEQQTKRQMQHIRDHCTWAHRAQEWETWLAALCNGRDVESPR